MNTGVKGIFEFFMDDDYIPVRFSMCNFLLLGLPVIALCSKKTS